MSGPILAHKRPIVLAICLLGALRLLALCALFPVFNPTDEQLHFDLIYKYAHGFLPGKAPVTLDRSPTRDIFLYQTYEYSNSVEVIRADHFDLPFWQLSSDEAAFKVDAGVAKDIHKINPEAFSPPVYYVIAAAWYKWGQMLHLNGIYLLYWLRFLNPVVYFCFLLLAYKFVKTYYPENHFLQISVPLVIAFVPQDVFYGMNREILDPLFFLLALFLLLRVYSEDFSSYLSYCICGLAIFLAVLVDYPSIVLFGALLLVVLAKLRPSSISSKSHQFVGIAIMLVSAVVPLGALLFRNYLVMGDPTGGRFRAAVLGWSIKPPREMLHHPIFSFGGLSYFLVRTIETYWRGEYLWHFEELSFPALDIFYQASTALLILAFIVYLFRSRKLHSPEQLCNRMCLLVFFSSILFLAALSLPWDFGRCFYPSRALPYFASGRLICGTLVPFAIIYLTGLQQLISRFRLRIPPFIAVIVLVALMFGSELAYSRDIFKSSFNLPSYVRYQHQRPK